MLSLAAFLLAANCTADPSISARAPAKVDESYLAAFDQPHSGQIAVTLDASGRVTGASVYQSTGDRLLDAAALEAAKASTYRPGTANCKPAGGTFAVAYNFPKAWTRVNASDCPREAHVVRMVHVNGSAFDWGTVIQQHASIKVTIDSDGSVMQAAILQSTRNRSMDLAALQAAWESTYAPAVDAVSIRRQASHDGTGSQTIVRCLPAARTYQFKVDYFRNP